jgi:diaminopimelate decarboxylase
MSEKKLPFTKVQIEEIVTKYPTPFHIYSAAGIRATAREFQAAFGSLPGYRNYFAVKALPNPAILRILKEEGMCADCSSLGELILAERVGFTGEEIMFTSNDTPVADFQKATDLGAIINFDDLSHIEFYEQNIGSLPEVGCVRYNPGSLKAGNELIGHPEAAKYGLTREQIFEAFQIFKKKGIKRFGLHTMVASNELNADYFSETAEILLGLVAEIQAELGIQFEFVNLGGGIGIPYRPEQQPVDLARVAAGVAAAQKQFDLSALKIVTESGRAVTGPHGYLVARALHEKQIYKHYIGLDACMSDLMRPALYGAYHHITVLGREAAPATETYDITGSLCENNDKFAIDRQLPKIAIGDLIVLHDTGAHGHAMGFNYNAKLRSAELLLHENGAVELIRRAETLEDYFATLEF